MSVENDTVSVQFESMYQYDEIPGLGYGTDVTSVIQLTSTQYLLGSNIDETITLFNLTKNESGDQVKTFEIVVSSATDKSDIVIDLSKLQALTRISDSNFMQHLQTGYMK